MPGLESLPMAKALNAGLRKAMLDDPQVILMGEDIGTLGGVFRVTEGLQGEFGVNRVLDTPLAESGIVGTAIGLAMRGYRPVCEIQFDGFVYPAFDQITSQLAKLTNRHEAGRVAPWQVVDAPTAYIEAQLKGIVGVTLKITRLQGKWKLGQNRNAADRAGLLAGYDSEHGRYTALAAVARAANKQE